MDHVSQSNNEAMNQWLIINQSINQPEACQELINYIYSTGPFIEPMIVQNGHWLVFNSQHTSKTDWGSIYNRLSESALQDLCIENEPGEVLEKIL